MRSSENRPKLDGIIILGDIDSEQMYDDYTTIVKTLCGDTAPGTVVIAGKMLARRENDELKLKSTIARYMGTRESGNRIIGMLLNRIPMRFYELERVVRKYVTEHYREKAERTAQEQRAEIRRQDKMRLRRSEDDESGDEDAQFHECRPVDEEQTKLGKAIEDLQRHSQRVNSEISKLRNSLDRCSNSNRDMRKDVEALCSKITSLTQTTSSYGARVEAQSHIVTDVKARLSALESYTKASADNVKGARDELDEVRKRLGEVAQGDDVQRLRDQVEGLIRKAEESEKASSQISGLYTSRISSLNARLEHDRVEIERLKQDNKELHLLLQAKDQEHIEETEALQHDCRVLKEQNESWKKEFVSMKNRMAAIESSVESVVQARDAREHEEEDGWFVA